MIYNIEFFNDNKYVFYGCYIAVLAGLLDCKWYFQAREIVKLYAFVQVVVKLPLIPVIYWYVESSKNIAFFSMTLNLSLLISSILLLLIVVNKTGVYSYKLSIKQLYISFVENVPLWFSNIVNIIKLKSIEIIIGNLFGMRELAIYDLANKIYSVPSLLATNINTAIFPKLIKNFSFNVIRFVVYAEAILSIFVVLVVFLFAEPVVEYLSHGLLMDAYRLSVLLSFNIFTYLVVGCCIYFVFVPLGKSNYVFYNQLIALVSFVCFALILWEAQLGALAIVLALIFSGFMEIISCAFQVKKILRLYNE